MSDNAIEVRVIPEPWGFVVLDSIVAPLYFISPDPSGLSSGPFEQRLWRRGGHPQLSPSVVNYNCANSQRNWPFYWHRCEIL